MEPTPPPPPRRISAEALRSTREVRSPEDLQRLSDFDQRIYLPLMISAILPIVVAAGRAANDSGVAIAVNIAAWLVFVVDLAVHVRLIRGYLRSPVGIFDLVVVIITAPWFLLPGVGGSQILVIARLARLVRLLFVTKGARRAARRLGKVGLFALAMVLFSSWMAYVAEHATNPEFASYGDAMWWGIVTLTTVGYGDVVPITEKGRVAGTALMLTGIATLGLISGTLASAFGPHRADVTGPDLSLDPPTPNAAPSAASTPMPTPVTPVTPVTPAATADLAAELAAVRDQLADIQRRLVAVTETAAARTEP